MRSVVEKRIRIALAARMRGQQEPKVPAVFYHGTSSKFLRSVMVNGLDPSKIKEGNYTDDKNTDYLNVSNKSFKDSIYFTKDASKAIGYAEDLTRKQDEKFWPMVVAVQISEPDALGDEDNYGFVRGIFSDNMHQGHTYSIGLAYTQILMRYESDYYDRKYSYKDALNKYVEAVLDYMKTKDPDFGYHLSKRADIGTLKRVIEGLFIAEARRHLSHLTPEKGFRDGYSGNGVILESFHKLASNKLQDKYVKQLPEGYAKRTMPDHFALPKPEKAEADFRRAMDTFIQMTKGFDKNRQGDDWWKKRRTLRMKKVVGFKGANKIVCIMVMSPWRQKPQVIKVVYGRVPSTFLPSYRENINAKADIVWQDKTGKEIAKNEQVPQMTVAYDTDEGYDPDGGVDVDDTVNGPEQQLFLDKVQDDEDDIQAQKDAEAAKKNPPPQPQQQGDEEDDDESGSNDDDESDSDSDDDSSDDSDESDDDDDDDSTDDSDDEPEPQKAHQRKPPPPPPKGKAKQSTQDDDDVEDDDDGKRVQPSRNGRNVEKQKPPKPPKGKGDGEEEDEDDDDSKEESALITALFSSGIL
jgi:hypothetical protein